MATSRIADGWRTRTLIRNGVRVVVSGAHAIKIFQKLGYVEEQREQDKEEGKP